MKWSTLILTIFCFFLITNNLSAQGKPTSRKNNPRKVQNPQAGRSWNDTMLVKSNPKVSGLQTQSTATNTRKMQRPQTGRIFNDTILVKDNPKTGGLQPQSARGNAQNVSNTPGANGKASKISGSQSGTPQGKAIDRSPMRNGETKTGQNQRKKGSQGVRGGNSGGSKSGSGTKRKNN